MNRMREQEEGYERVGREAFERYLADLVRVSAAEEERQGREIHNNPPRFEVISVKVNGSYPSAGVDIRYRDNRRGEEGSEFFDLYGTPEFFDENGKPKPDADYIAGEMLRLLREE